MFFRDSAGTNPAVLLLHGQILGSTLFTDLAKRLELRFRVLVPDLPGYGRSQLPARYSLEGVREELERDIGERRCADVAVVGFSIGTYHALALALAGRVRVRALALLGPLAGLDPDGKAAFRGYAQAVRSGADFATLYAQMVAPPAWAAAHPEEVERVRDEAARARRDTLAVELDAVATCPDLRPQLGKLRMPVLIRCGTEDRNTPHAWAEEAARAMPGARLESVPAAGHALLVQDAGATVHSIERFLTEVGASSAAGEGRR